MPTYFRLFFGFVAVAVAALALKANADFYGATFATDEHSRLTYIGLACATCAVKLAFPAGLSYVAGHPAIKAFGWLAVMCAVLFDIFGAVGYMQQTRGTRLESKGIEAREYRAREDEVKRLKSSALELQGVRSTAEVSAELDGAERLASGCDKSAHLDRCKRPFTLAAELARARERDKRAAKAAEAETVYQNLTKPIGSADPQADAFAGIAGRIGFSDGGNFITLIFSILIIVIFEVVPAVAALLALYQPPKVVEPVKFEIADTCAKPKAPRGPTPIDLMPALEALLQSGAGGLKTDAGKRWIEGPQRRLALALGLSTAKLSRGLAALSSAGRLELTTGPTGTLIKFR